MSQGGQCLAPARLDARTRRAYLARMRIPPGLEAFARRVTLPRSGTKLFLYDTGASGAPAIVLVHGLGDEADTWRGVIPGLAGLWRVIAPDLPGFGRSPLPGRRLTPRFLSSLLLELLESLQLPRVVFGGSSLGAALVQLTAIVRPSAVEALILVDGGLLVRSRVPPSLLAMLLPGIGERRYRRLAKDPGAAYASLLPYYARLDLLPDAEQKFLRERVGERVASDSQRRAYFSVFRSYFGWRLLHGGSAALRARELGSPTTYIWGSKDRIIPLSAAHAVRVLQPDAGLAVIDDAGHLPHQERPEEFLRAVDRAHRML